jgi:hypothetical protein
MMGWKLTGAHNAGAFGSTKANSNALKTTGLFGGLKPRNENPSGSSISIHQTPPLLKPIKHFWTSSAVFFSSRLFPLQNAGQAGKSFELSCNLK